MYSLVPCNACALLTVLFVLYFTKTTVQRGCLLVVMGWWVESKSSLPLQLTPFNSSFSLI